MHVPGFSIAASNAAPHRALSISAASQPDLQVQQDVSHGSFGPLHQKDDVIHRQAGSLQAGTGQQQRQGTAHSLSAEQEGQHLASNSAPQGAHGGMPASSEDTAANLPEPGSRAAAVVASPAASRPATQAGGQQQAPAKHGLVPTGEVATLTEAPCNGCADSGSSTAAVLPHLSREWGSPAQQEQVNMHAERQAERAPVLHKEEPDALQTTQAQGLRAQQQHEPAVLLSRQVEEANSQQVLVPSAWPAEVAQEVAAQQTQDAGALPPEQPQLRAVQQRQPHIALPPGQVELAGQSEEPGALLSRQAQVARQREVQRRSRATHMQSLQAQYVRQLHAAGEKQL